MDWRVDEGGVGGYPGKPDTKPYLTDPERFRVISGKYRPIGMEVYYASVSPKIHKVANDVFGQCVIEVAQVRNSVGNYQIMKSNHAIALSGSDTSPSAPTDLFAINTHETRVSLCHSLLPFL